jgi:hypothetical protein
MHATVSQATAGTTVRQVSEHDVFANYYIPLCHRKYQSVADYVSYASYVN